MEKEKTAAAKKTASKKSGKPSIINIFKIVLVVVIILVPLIIYFAKQRQINNLKVENEAAMAKFREEATLKISETEQLHLRTIARMTAWVVKDEMMNDRRENLDAFLGNLIKENGYRQIICVSAAGDVLISTDKKFEGQKYSGPLSEEIRKLTDTKSALQPGGELMTLSPVTVNGNNYGTVVITYQPQKIQFSDTLTIGR